MNSIFSSRGAERRLAQSQFFLAAAQGDLPALRAALAQGADARALDFGSQRETTTALILAAEAGPADIVQELIPLSDIDARDHPEECAALLKALERGHESIASALLDAGADARLGDRSGITPLMIALHHQCRDLARRLIPLSNVWASDELDNHALALCVKLPANAGLAPDLIRAGASPARFDMQGLTALHEAVLCDNMAFINAVAGMFDPRLPDQNGMLPIDLARFRGDLDMIGLLEAWALSMDEKIDLGAATPNTMPAAPKRRI